MSSGATSTPGEAECRWATTAMAEQEAGGGAGNEKQLVDLSPSEQVARGKKLLSMLQDGGPFGCGGLNGGSLGGRSQPAPLQQEPPLPIVQQDSEQWRYQAQPHHAGAEMAVSLPAYHEQGIDGYTDHGSACGTRSDVANAWMPVQSQYSIAARTAQAQAVAAAAMTGQQQSHMPAVWAMGAVPAANAPGSSWAPLSTNPGGLATSRGWMGQEASETPEMHFPMASGCGTAGAAALGHHVAYNPMPATAAVTADNCMSLGGWGPVAEGVPALQCQSLSDGSNGYMQVPMQSAYFAVQSEDSQAVYRNQMRAEATPYVPSQNTGVHVY